MHLSARNLFPCRWCFCTSIFHKLVDGSLRRCVQTNARSQTFGSQLERSRHQTTLRPLKSSSISTRHHRRSVIMVATWQQHKQMLVEKERQSTISAKPLKIMERKSIPTGYISPGNSPFLKKLPREVGVVDYPLIFYSFLRRQR